LAVSVDLPLLCRHGRDRLYTVDIAIVQEFVPAYKRGWITGLTTYFVPAGTLLGALAGAYLESHR